MRKHGKLDDDYECFITWPLFYALGGDRKFYDESLAQWSAITRQWTYQHQLSVKDEFVKQYDMLHLSEGYVGFQYFGLADPTVPENIDRAKRFAGFYLNEVPGVQNYDPINKIIRSPITGSAGPAFESDGTYVLNYGHASLYPIVKKLPSGWDKDKKTHDEMQKLYNKVIICGDVPMNLAITGLISHAYILTGDEKYKKWVLEYVDAWIERTKKNNGIIPDNTDLKGVVGGNRNGQWWGGFFGWKGRYSLEMIFNGLITASECAYEISGDPKYLDFLRSQADMLLSKAIEKNGNLLIPFKVGPDGFFDYRPMEPYILSHLWKASMDSGDWARLEKLRKGVKNNPYAYHYAESPNPPAEGAEMWYPDSTLYDWNFVYNDLPGNKQRLNEPPHLRWLAGENPDWPLKAMKAEMEQVRRNIERLQSDKYENSWGSQTVLTQNPIFTNCLAQMTTGAPFTSFNGGLLMARVRYFDIDNARPGLPEGVAALVEKMEADKTVLTLANTNIFDTRKVIVQAGAYAEHSFTDVKYEVIVVNDSGEKTNIRTFRTDPVNKEFFVVELPPSTTIRIEIGTKRFVNKPTYAFPWQNKTVTTVK